ncbi:MAG: ABC transporter substrate-binding protein, partial [Christensenella sp.]
IRTDEISDLLYDFNYGEVSAMYADFSDGSNKYRGNVELVGFDTNNLVFCAMNPTKVYFANRLQVAQGFSYAINRKELCDSLLKDCATPVWYPFCPSWVKLIDAEPNNDIYSPEAAKELFYNSRLYIGNNVMQYYGTEVNLKIIVNQESFTKTEVAKKVAADLSSFGFLTSVVSLKWEDYTKAIKNGDYDIYIGEIKFPNNMDLSAALTSLSFNVSSVFSQAVANFNNGQIGVKEILAAFREEMPFIPLYYTRAALAINRSVNGQMTPSEDYLFFNINTW